MDNSNVLLQVMRSVPVVVAVTSINTGLAVFDMVNVSSLTTVVT